ncbi:MAG: hypothetical protein ACJ8EW_29105, partial [Rhizobium sp.]|uniref:hypothetical protein n=1 Tax=Rhizobium sp. TaxID=391 RepID=UPI0038997E99
PTGTFSPLGRRGNRDAPAMYLGPKSPRNNVNETAEAESRRLTAVSDVQPVCTTRGGLTAELCWLLDMIDRPIQNITL